MNPDPRVQFLEEPSRAHFDALVLKTRQTLLRSAYRRTSDWQTADDVVQQVYLSVLTRLIAPDRVKSGLGYLVRTTAHVVRDELRGDSTTSQSKSSRAYLDFGNDVAPSS